MIKKILILSAALLLVGLFFLNFSLVGQKIRIQKENGVEVIYNPKNPQPPPGSPTKLILEKVFTLGNEKEGEGSFSQLAGFAVNSQERVFALDPKECEVKVFDKQGKFLFRFGRQGQGPGELNNPTGIQITPSGEIIVEDPLNQRLSFFSSEGRYLKSVSSSKALGLSAIVLDSTGNIIGRQVTMSENKMKWEVKKYSPDLTPLYTIDSIDFPNPLEGKFNLFAYLMLYEIGWNDYLFFGVAKEYEIKIFNPEGKLTRKIIKEYDPVKVTEEEKKKILAEFPEVGFGIKERIVFPEHFPPYQLLSIDEQGRLFVRTFEKGKNKDEYYFDIFDQQGKYIAKIPLKIVPRIWKNKKLYALEQTKEGYNFLHCYNVNWKN